MLQEPTACGELLLEAGSNRSWIRSLGELGSVGWCVWEAGTVLLLQDGRIGGSVVVAPDEGFGDGRAEGFGERVLAWG
jgi:hypothetical protein